MDTQTLFILVIIGLLAGIMSGMTGTGGGIVIVPALVYLLGLTQHEAQGTSLAMMLLPIGIMAVFNYYKEGAINYWYAGTLAVTFIVGGYFGSKIALNIDQSLLKKIFGGVMMIVAVKMMFFSK